MMSHLSKNVSLYNLFLSRILSAENPILMMLIVCNDLLYFIDKNTEPIIIVFSLFAGQYT